MRSSLFVKSADTAIIERTLQDVAIGDEITFEAISKAVGRDVRSQCAGSLQSARRILEKRGIWFEALAGVGLRRLDSVGNAAHVAARRQRAKRAADRGLAQSQAVVLTDIPEADRPQFIATIAQLGAMQLFGSGSALKKIEKITSNAQQPSIGQTLELFK